MSHKIIEKKPGEIKLEIEISKEKLQAATKIVAEELAKTVKVDGFRPGKAPVFMVEKEVGKDRFWAEVIDRVVPESYLESVIAENIQAISAPQIEIREFLPGEKLLFWATVALMPEIKDLKYKGLKIKTKEEKVTEAEEKEALETILKRSGEDKEADRPAEKGDRVEIDFKGTLKGLPFEGGESKNHPVVLGSGTLIPGFEEKIEGKKPGEEFDFDIEFPKEYHAKNLAGEKANFKVKLNRVIETEIPKADDEWAKKIGFEKMEDVKSEIKKQLVAEKELAARRKTEEEIINTIIEKNKIEAPDLLVQEEIHRLVHEAEHNLSHAGLTMDKFLEMSNKTLTDLEKEMKPEAERRVKIGIVLGEVAKLEKIQVAEKEIQEEIDRIVGLSMGEAKEEDLRAAYEAPEKKQEIGNHLVVQKTLNILWEQNVLE